MMMETDWYLFTILHFVTSQEILILVIVTATCSDRRSVLPCNYHFFKSLEEQSCDMHMFTYDLVVFPAATGSTAHHPTLVQVSLQSY